MVTGLTIKILIWNRHSIYPTSQLCVLESCFEKKILIVFLPGHTDYRPDQSTITKNGTTINIFNFALKVIRESSGAFA